MIERSQTAGSTLPLREQDTTILSPGASPLPIMRNSSRETLNNKLEADRITFSQKYREILAKNAASYNESVQYNEQQMELIHRGNGSLTLSDGDDTDYRDLYGGYGGGLSE